MGDVRNSRIKIRGERENIKNGGGGEVKKLAFVYSAY